MSGPAGGMCGLRTYIRRCIGKTAPRRREATLTSTSNSMHIRILIKMYVRTYVNSCNTSSSNASRSNTSRSTASTSNTSRRNASSSNTSSSNASSISISRSGNAS